MKKRQKTVLVIICLVAMLMAGTFAWGQIVSHINEFSGEKNNVTLHDDFDEKTGQKEVYVENLSSAPLLVRIKLDEAMSLTDHEWRPGDSEWIAHTYEAIAEDCEHTNHEGELFHDYFEWEMGGWKYYMPGDGTQKLVQDTKKYNDGDPDVKKTPNAEIIKISDYLAMEDKDKMEFIGWVYDEDGYAYWSRPLGRQEASGLLLSRVNVSDKLFNEEYYYAINVIAEAVDASDIPMWLEGADPVLAGEDKQDEASAQGKMLINFLVANFNLDVTETDVPDLKEPEEIDETDPIANPDKDDDNKDEDTILLVKTPSDSRGFAPIIGVDDLTDDRYTAFIEFDPLTGEYKDYAHYHDGYIHLKDIVIGEDLDSVTAKATDSKYAKYIDVAECTQHPGEQSIRYSYEPTYREFFDGNQYGKGPYMILPIEVELTGADGKSAKVNIQMKYSEYYNIGWEDLDDE